MTKTNSTIVAVFHDRSQAQQAINELKRAGFREDQIGVTARDGKLHGAVAGDGTGDNYAAEAATAGVATGAGVGALWGLGIVAGLLPAIGPAIAGGTLAAILSSAAAGAAAAGVAGALIGLGIPKEDAEFYESEFNAGRTILTVNAGAKNAEALSIIRRFGGYDRSGASTSPTQTASRTSVAESDKTGAACTVPQLSGENTIQAREEQLHVIKQREQVGEVTVRKEVHTEHKTIEVPVEREEVVIERRAVSGRAPAKGGPLGEGQQIRVPVTEEHVEVTKTPVVKEEVTVGKRKVKGTEHVEADLRKEEIKVEKEGDASCRDSGR